MTVLNLHNIIILDKTIGSLKGIRVFVFYDDDVDVFWAVLAKCVN